MRSCAAPARSSCGAADTHQVPAGGALAVDRDGFAAAVTAALAAHPLVTIERDEVAGLPPDDWDSVIVATGPLTSPALADAIQAAHRRGSARLLRRDRADRPFRFDRHGHRLVPVALRQGRPGRHRRRLHQLPARHAREYEAFVDALLSGEQHKSHDWEKVPYFDGCLPIEVMAERGRETLRHGPMKPVGLTNRHKPTEKPYAVVQLRQDNALGTLFNMVGFQTRLRYAIQADIFRMIPGLGRRAVRPPRRPAPQHVPQLAEAARRRRSA